MAKLTIYRNGKLYTAKEGLSLADLKAGGYFERHPGAIVCKPRPSLTTLNKWSYDGIARAVDGCRVEPDGTCEHGAPSWLLALGYI